MSTFVQYAGSDGVGGKFTIPFPYLLQQNVKVSVNGFPQVQGVHYQFDDPSSIRFMPWAVPISTTVVEIRRDTSSDTPLVDYQNGSVLTADDLDTGVRQNFYLFQELTDRINALLGGASSRLSNGQYTNAQELIDAAVGDVLNSELLATLQSRISDIDSNAESILQQASRLAEVQAVIDSLLEIDGEGIATYVQNAVETLTTADEALAARVALLGAEADGGSSFILDLDTVHVGPSESLAGRLSTISSSINGNTAAISTQQTVVNGLAAQYVVKTDVNGRVAGFGLYNTGASSDFIVLANRFAVVDPSNNANVKVPFTVVGGVCYMQNVVIADALIENLTVGKLTSGTLTATITQNANINVGTGKIIFDNGAVMLVEGVGFGSANQFIMWFGPRQTNLANCTETNATFYLKTNGSAYFGGSLSAGTLYNSRQTTDLTDTAGVTIGPFMTNGNTKTITLSYSLFGSRSYAGSGSGSGAISATVYLYQTIAPGSEVHVATLGLSGSYAYETADPGIIVEEQSMGGSTTYTDNVAGTADRTYRAQIVARSIRTGHTLDQRITLTSSEQ